MSKFDWKKRYLAGDITFADALQFYLQESDAPEFLIGAYEEALRKYLDGDVSDLAEPFGIAMKKREKNAEDRKTLVSNVRFHVDAYAKKNFPKTDPGKYENTAFHEAGKLLKKSPSQIFDIYYGK